MYSTHLFITGFDQMYFVSTSFLLMIISHLLHNDYHMTNVPEIMGH